MKLTSTTTIPSASSTAFFDKYREDFSKLATHQITLDELLDLHAFDSEKSLYNYEFLRYLLQREYASFQQIVRWAFKTSSKDFVFHFDFNEILSVSKNLSEDVGAILNIVSSNKECLICLFKNNVFMKYVLENFSFFTQSFYNKFEELLFQNKDIVEIVKSSSIFDFCHKLFENDSELSELTDVNQRIYEFIHRYSKDEQNSILRLIQASEDNHAAMKELFKSPDVFDSLGRNSDVEAAYQPYQMQSNIQNSQPLVSAIE